MKVAVMFVYVDHNRRGARYRGLLQPQIGPAIAALLPPGTDVEVVNETWEGPDWSRDYDLLFMTCAHSDFDRARQVSHYWRRRGAKTVFGGALASTYPDLCQPFFDAVCVGDAEGAVPEIYRDVCSNDLKPRYYSGAHSLAERPMPRLDLLATRQMLPLSFETSRGCPFSCNFCVLTGLGTPYVFRPPALVARDVVEGRRMLKGLVPEYRLWGAAFVDNNIGGNLRHLRELCEALTPLRVGWGSAITFNCVSNPELVALLSRAGCRTLFVGLESFNERTIAHMHKSQNRIQSIRSVLEQCRDSGILVMSGLLVNTETDDPEYLASIPTHLVESGLYVPTYISFECPFPGTPVFRDLADSDEPRFMPGALLRDFTGHTLVVRPRHSRAQECVEAYTELLDRVFSRRAKWRKVLAEVPKLVAAGFLESAFVDIAHQWTLTGKSNPDRTYVAGTDSPPPEAGTVPLTDTDFASEAERDAVMEPWAVTDEIGHVLPHWRQHAATARVDSLVTASRATP